MKRALGLTLLYIGVFVALVLVQFTRGPGLSESFGSFSVRATYPKAARGKPSAPETLRLVAAGLSIELSPKSQAASLAADGSATPLSLSAIDRLPNGVRIRMSQGVALLATADKAGRFSLSASAPDGISAVKLRFLPSTARFVDKEGQRSIQFSGNTYTIALAAGSIDGKTGYLSLQPGDPGLSLARVEVAQVKVVKPEATGTFTAPAPKDPDAFKAEIAAWRDRIWTSLSVSRFDPAKITWKGGDGQPAFSEKALAVYLAEALARGSYADALARLRPARELWPDKLGYLSAPYFGGLTRKMRDFEAADQAETKRLAQLVADKSPLMLEKEGLLPYLMDRSPSGLGQDALHAMAGFAAAKLSLRQAAGLVGCAVDAKALLKDEDNPLKDAGAAADRLVAAIRKSSSGYFLISEDDGSSDIRLSLLAGNCLADYGAIVSKPGYVGIGQSLIETVLGLSDAQGFLPSRILAKAGSADQRTGTISPEEIYPLAADNPYYPHEVGFVRDSAPGIWAWTCSPSLTIKVNGSRYIFTARFPEGRSHFLSFYGIKPFANIQLYDIDYSPDSEFENYDASGYLYNKAGGALYLKMKHKKESEDIKLSF